MRKENRILQIAIYLSIYTSILVGLFIGGNHFVVLPLKRIEEELKDAQSELAKMEKMIREVPNPKKNMEEIQKKMEELKKKAASRRELPRIIQQLTKKSSELGIEIISIRPLEETVREKNLPAGVSKAYVEVTLKASYKKIGEYLKAIKELPIILTLESLFVTKPAEEEIEKGEENTLIATLVISSYTVWKI